MSEHTLLTSDGQSVTVPSRILEGLGEAKPPTWLSTAVGTIPFPIDLLGRHQHVEVRGKHIWVGIVRRRDGLELVAAKIGEAPVTPVPGATS